MITLEVILFILFIVIIVTAIAENINVPYPILLVISGLLVGLIPNMPSWQPPNDIMLTLFLPPILFSAARTISWHDISHNIISIFSLAFLLVVLTTLISAWVLSWIVPYLQFSTALVLGAIISPTDIVAAHSILSKLNAKPYIIRTIKVESLFNDACGIMLYKAGLLLVFGQATTVTELGLHTLFISFFGILVGLGFAFIANIIITNFLTSSENDLPIIMSMILAYITYMFAQEIGVSSVLAVVSAGLYYKKTAHAIRATTRLAEKAVWDALLFFLNGLIFISIGIELPDFLQKVSYLPGKDILTFASLTIVAMLSLRFFWVTLTDYFNQLWNRYRKHPRYIIKSQWKANTVITWSGMRGLVSITLALALPLHLDNGDPFPARNLIILLTIIVILFTLVGQGLTLPWLVKLLKVQKSKSGEFSKMREVYQQLSHAALDHISNVSHHPEISSDVAKRIVENYYTSRLLGLYTPHQDNHHQKKHQATKIQAELLLARTLQFERDLLLQMRQQGSISEEIYMHVLQKLDRDEVNFSAKI